MALVDLDMAHSYRHLRISSIVSLWYQTRIRRPRCAPYRRTPVLLAKPSCRASTSTRTRACVRVSSTRAAVETPTTLRRWPTVCKLAVANLLASTSRNWPKVNQVKFHPLRSKLKNEILFKLFENQEERFQISENLERSKPKINLT